MAGRIADKLIDPDHILLTQSRYRPVIGHTDEVVTPSELAKAAISEARESPFFTSILN